MVNVLSVVEDPLDEVALAGRCGARFFTSATTACSGWPRACKGGLTEGLERADEIAELPPPDRGAAIGPASFEPVARHQGSPPPGEPARRSCLTSLVSRPLSCASSWAAQAGQHAEARPPRADFDRQEGFSLADFVARLRADLNNPPHEEQAATTEEDSPTIRLMSIHQAKGLEFPIVVIPDLNRKPNPRDSFLGLHPDLAWWFALLARPRLLPKMRPTRARARAWAGWPIKRSRRGRSPGSARLFYVAATRARDHLILSAGIESVSDEEDGTPAEQASPRPVSPACELLMERFDWRTGLCLAPLPETWPAPRVDVIMAGPESSPPPGTPPLALTEAVAGDRAGDRSDGGPPRTPTGRTAAPAALHRA